MLLTNKEMNLVENTTSLAEVIILWCYTKKIALNEIVEYANNAKRITREK